MALWVGLGAPFVGAVLASYATDERRAIDGSNAVFAFLVLAGCTFGPTLLVRALARRNVLREIVLGQAVTLGFLSLAAFGLSNDSLSQTITVLASVWLASLGGSVSGHVLGAAIAARRAEHSVGGAAQAIVTDVERQALVELEYLTQGWQVAQINRSQEATGEYDLKIELESGILERHGYRPTVTERARGGGLGALASLATDDGSDPDVVRVTYERVAIDGVPQQEPVPVRKSEWEIHGGSRDP